MTVRKGSITNHKHEKKREKERKLMRRLGINSEVWLEHKRKLAAKQK